MRRLAALLPVLFALAGCGQGTTDSTQDFEGEERAVAQVVEDLQRAGERNDPEQICSEILARELTERLSRAGTTCAAEMDRAIDDADDFELVVEDVTVTGDTASATVRRATGEQDRRTVFRFARVSGAWRATELAG